MTTAAWSARQGSFEVCVLLGVFLLAPVPPVAEEGGGAARPQHLPRHLLPAPDHYAHDFRRPACCRARLVGVNGGLVLSGLAAREATNVSPAPGAELPARTAARRAHEVSAVKPSQVYVAGLAW